MAFVAASSAPLNIYVDGNAVIPAGVYALKGSGFISDPIIGALTITMADGAQLQNLGFVEGQMVLEANSTALTPLVFNAASGGAPNSLILRFNGILRNNGSIPMIEVPGGTFFVLGMVLNATLLVGGTAPIVNANGGAGTAVIVGVLGTSSINNNWLTGPVGCALLYQNLGGAPSPLPTNAGFLGTTIQNLLLGASCTGPATRPVNPFGALPIGASVFDQSLGKAIWWDGTQWVDATGAPALGRRAFSSTAWKHCLATCVGDAKERSLDLSDRSVVPTIDLDPTAFD
jgi:hypothetical protein